MTMSVSTIILEYVCPTLGGFVGVYMFYAPFQDVQKALAKGSLGDLNPLPWAFTLGNCCGWVFYSILISNVFVFVPNMIGFFFAVWFNLAASKLLYRQQFTPLPTTATTMADLEAPEKQSSSTTTSNTQSQPQYSAPSYDYIILFMVVIWSAMIALIGLADAWSLETKQWIVGGASNLNLLFFYGAPLSTIATVLRTRNTASIHFLTMVTNTANGCFWAAYGFAILDYLIFVPNGLGALLGFIQFALYATFPRVMMDHEEQDGEAEEEDVAGVVIPTKNLNEQDLNASGLTARDDSEAPLSQSVQLQTISESTTTDSPASIGRR